MLKEAHIAKVEKMAEERESDKLSANNANPPPAEDPPEDDRAKWGAGRFDPSVGNQAQKTEKHPWADAQHRASVDRMLREGQEAREFFDDELAIKRAWIEKIEADNRARWR
jgi:hypothetical protein